MQDILGASASFSLKEISDIVLEEATKLTESIYCYVAYVDPENKDSVVFHSVK